MRLVLQRLLVTAAFLVGADRAAHGAIVPVYSATFGDAITGDNEFIANDGKHYWTIDPNADSYQNEFYERPTAQTYQVRTAGGGEKFAAAEYFGNLDIVRGKAGFDSQFLYFAIEMFGLDKVTNDGNHTFEGLLYEYDIRLSTDPDGRNGLLLRSDQPLLKNGTDFGLLSNSIHKDTDGDVGGRGLINNVGPSGLNVTKSDNPEEEHGLNGFDAVIVQDGKIKDDPNKDAPVLYSRIDPTNPNIVEFAFDYQALGLGASFPNLIRYLDFQAIKGDPEDPQKYFWNDKYTKSEAGSPYRATSGDLSKSEFGTQGLGNIYELDTLRGRGFPSLEIPPPDTVPEPSSILVFAGLAAFLGAGFTRTRRSLAA